MFLAESSQLAEYFSNAGRIALQLAVSDVWSTIVYVQITDDPVVVLKFFDVVKPGGEEQTEPSAALDILLDKNATVGTAVSALEDIITYLEVAAQLLTPGVLARERVLRLELVLQVVVDLGERVREFCLDRRLLCHREKSDSLCMEEMAEFHQEALLDMQASQCAVHEDEVALSTVGSLCDLVDAGPFQYLLSEGQQC